DRGGAGAGKPEKSQASDHREERDRREQVSRIVDVVPDQDVEEMGHGPEADDARHRASPSPAGAGEDQDGNPGRRDDDTAPGRSRRTQPGDGHGVKGPQRPSEWM